MSDSADDRDTKKSTPWNAEDSAPTLESAPAQVSVKSAEEIFDSETLRALGQRYDLLAELGRGGMGIVYKARDRETGDVVGLKVLQPGIAARADLMERFKSELLLARKVTHKNVCRVHELIRLGEAAAIAMEYVEGESLRAVLRREQGLSVRYALKVARQVMAGLAEAHAQGVVHRDLKPENILLARDGSIKVMDFGIARSLETETVTSAHILGTPAYMSPEQAQGKPADARSDIYSLGLILYEMFAGEPTFSAETTTALLMKQIKEPPTPPRKLEPNLPDFLERIILKCLAKNPQKRFQSIAEIESALSEQRPAGAVLEEEPKPAGHHVVWGTGDVVLVCLATAAAICILILGRMVFPASKFPLELDALAARREAEAVGKKLGRPFPSRWEAELEYREEEYMNRLLAQFGAEEKNFSPAVIYGRVEPPMFWKVRFWSEQDTIAFSSEAAANRYARLDRKGKVVEFLNPVSQWSLARDYRAPPAEQRREIAKKAVADVCGFTVPAAAPVETYGGQGGASYTAKWKQGEVSLFAENVTSVNCVSPMDVDAAHTAMNVNVIMRLFRAMGLLVAMSLLLMICVAFVKGQCHNSPLLWRRLPLAAAAGLPSAWLLLPGVFGGSPSWAVLLLGGVGATVLMLLGLVAVEHHLARRLPAEVASYRLALRGRWLEPAVGLAVLRGALCGLILMGALTALGRVSLEIPPFASRASLPLMLMQFWLGWYVDPALSGYAVASSWPAMYVVSSAVFHSLFVGLIIAGLYWMDCKQYLRGAEKKGKVSRAIREFALLLLVGANIALLAVGLRLHFVSSIAFGFTIFVVPALWATAVAWIFVRYGALAAIVATATNVLWTLNGPLLLILREVGNAPQWAVFIGWGVFVLGATALAFRGELRQAMTSGDASAD